MPKTRKKEARFSDIAAKAGVGIATVDRVLNDRGNVSPATALKVVQAARELRINRLVPSPYRKQLRYKVILARRRFGFAKRMNQAFIKCASTFAKSMTLERSFVNEDDAATLDHEITSCAGKYDGLIVLPVNTLEVRNAIRKISPALPVITIATDVDDDARHAFVGINNVKAGRTAAFLCTPAMHSGKRAAALCLGHAFASQGDRVRGFEAYMAGHHLSEQVSTHVIDPATFDACFAFTRRLICETPNLAALYDAGVYDDSVVAGVYADAVAAAIVAEKKDRQIHYIGHELTQGTVQLMQDGVMNFVIDQDPDQQALRALEMLLHIHGIIDHRSPTSQTEFRIYCKENVPNPAA
ncbi:MAG: LacI family DNA-binding transcriptional regulator [Rhodospirillaceae bacterium]|jgi:LacI family transcriptional regulator|nr:LacI family DNA-binding transcriptional regulator [Rhodospirillaceae bacterium]